MLDGKRQKKPTTAHFSMCGTLEKRSLTLKLGVQFDYALQLHI